MSWKCPMCNCTDNLSVSVQVEARLIQSEDNFETEVDTEPHVWDECSLMTCGDCHHCDASGSLKQP